MTLILGSKCIDGIVLIGDKKMTRTSGSSTYEDKLFQDVPNVVLGASGVVGLYDKFRTEIFSILQQNPNMKPSEFISESERLVFELNRKYVERTRGGTIELLVANGKLLTGELQYVSPNGVGEVVRRYQMIGSGEPYAEFFLKKLWRQNMTMREVAILGWAILKIIEENALDEAVGVKEEVPQIVFVPDWETDLDLDKLPVEQKNKFATRQIRGEELKTIFTDTQRVYSEINNMYDMIKI